MTARYVKLDIVGTTADTFWFISELEVNSYDPKVVEVAVPAEPGNLAAGKEWTGDTEIGSSYKGDITDGKIDPDGKYDQTIWYGFDQRKSGDSVGTIIIDLGKLYSGLDEIRAFVWHEPGSGIAVPQYYNFYISEDGETYTLVTSVAGVKSAPTWVGTDNTETLTARYVKLDIVGTAKDTFWFIGELEVNVYEDAPEVPDEPEQPEEPEIEGNKITISHVNAYTWGVFYEMIITGEGQNCVTKLGYDCTWWIAIKVDNVDGVYTVTAIEGNGTAKEMTASADGFIVYCFSNDAESFAAAQAIKVGDTMAACTVDWSKGAASETPIGYLIFVEGEEPEEPDQPEEPDVSEEPSEEPSEDSSEDSSEEPSEEPSVEPSVEPSEDDSSELPPTSDAGVLVFAILGVLAIVGAAVVIKVRN